MGDDRPPTRLPIARDDYHARFVGRTPDGRQFFLTTPFEPFGSDFVALFLFDADGRFLEARIDDLGPRGEGPLPGNVKRRSEHEERLIERRLAELGDVTFGDIVVEVFRVELHGLTFGLMAHAPEEPDEPWCVTIEPGDYMAFYPPWGGDYDT